MVSGPQLETFGQTGYRSGYHIGLGVVRTLYNREISILTDIILGKTQMARGA